MSSGLSVVVPFVNGPSDLDSTLEALSQQRSDLDLEVLVVDRVGTPDLLQKKHAWASFIPVPRDMTIPDMRAVAFRMASKESVAVIEDHVVVPPGWARALLDAQTPDSPVVGGAVDNAATERLVDWAAFLCEYSQSLPPLPAGKSDWLTGNNVVYPRTLLQKHRRVVESGAWENQLHDAIKADGVALTCVPSIVVGHKMHYTVGLYMSQRFLYSRSYAGTRARGQSLPKRLIMAAASVALPPVLLKRIVSRVRPRAPYSAKLGKTLPLIALFVVAWAAGEMVGYVLGSGRSLSKVR